MSINILKKNSVESLDYIKEHSTINPEIAVVLGSGMGKVVDSLKMSQRIPTSAIPNYPASTVPGHG